MTIKISISYIVVNVSTIETPVLFISTPLL